MFKSKHNFVQYTYTHTHTDTMKELYTFSQFSRLIFRDESESCGIYVHTYSVQHPKNVICFLYDFNKTYSFYNNIITISVPFDADAKYHDNIIRYYWQYSIDKKYAIFHRFFYHDLHWYIPKGRHKRCVRCPRSIIAYYTYTHNVKINNDQ